MNILEDFLVHRIWGCLAFCCWLMWTAPSLRAEVSIEGELQFHSVYRDNVYDFLDKRVIDPANPGLGEAGRDDAHLQRHLMPLAALGTDSWILAPLLGCLVSLYV